VCGGQDHGRAFQADLGGKAAFERAEDRAWLDDLRQNGRRQIQPAQQIASPIAAAGVIELRRGSNGELTHCPARQPVVEQVRDHQQGASLLECRTPVLSHGEQLVERVQLHELDARLGKDLLPRYTFQRQREHGLVPRIAIVTRVAQ